MDRKLQLTFRTSTNQLFVLTIPKADFSIQDSVIKAAMLELVDADVLLTNKKGDLLFPEKAVKIEKVSTNITLA